MSTPSPRLILASGSPQRNNLMLEAGYTFEVIVPDDSAEDCGICSTGGPAELVVELALRKAADVAGAWANKNSLNEQVTGGKAIDEKKVDGPALIIACDTVAECGGAVLGKPRDEDHAHGMLEQLRGQHQRVFSGLCLWPIGIAGAEDTPRSFLAVTELRMDPISDENLDEYLSSGLWRGKAGAFGYQDRHGWLHVLKGSESNVIGLPMELLAEELKNFGC